MFKDSPLVEWAAIFYSNLSRTLAYVHAYVDVDMSIQIQINLFILHNNSAEFELGLYEKLVSKV